MTIEINRSNNQDIDGLLWGWAWGDGGPESLTFSFPTSTAEYTGYAAINGFSSFNAAQQTAVRNVLTQIASFCNLTFTETTAPGADLRYAEATSTQVGTGVFPVTTAYAFPPQPGIPTDVQGDNWFNTVYYNNPVLGLYAYMTVMHETGHSLGLKHGHETRTSHGVTFPTLPADHDSFEYSIMTYRAFPGSPTDYDHAVDHPTTYMQDDIAALQYLYGANYGASAHNGDTVYTWSTTTGEASIDGVGQGVPYRNFVFMTIWDGGGTDTYDFSNYTTNLRVYLDPGAWTVLDTSVAHAQRADLGNDGAGGPEYFARGNIANALTDPNNPSETLSLIENAVGGSGHDTLRGNEIGNTLRGNDGSDQLYGDGGVDTLYGGSGNDQLSGGDGGDTLYGGDGNDQLLGDAGVDTLYGGNGDDIYLVDDLGDETIESSNGVGSGYDLVFSSVSYILGLGIEKLKLVGLASNGTGSADDNYITGNSVANVLSGLAGNDILNGDVGDDTLDGGSGADTMNGGDGSDIYTVDDAEDVVVELLLEGYDTVESSVSYTLGSWVERLILLNSASAITGTGNELNNLIYGNGADNVLSGLEGNDGMGGGDGNDWLDGGAGDDSIDGSYGDDYLYGGDGNDALGGQEGNDMLDGGAGADHMDGDYGDDVYEVDNVGDVAEELFTSSALAGGIDTVQSLVSHALGGGIENLILTGTAASDGTGNEHDNLILGNSGNNMLVGLQGTDTVSYAGATSGVTVTLGLTAAQNTIGAGTDTVWDFENLTGSHFDDVLTGDVWNNVLSGLAGNDVLDGGLGADVMYGGAGNDTYYVDRGGDASGGDAAIEVVNGLDAGGVDLVYASVSVVLNAGVEDLTILGVGNTNGTGNALNNVLTGNGAANSLSGLAGNDVVSGGAGDDTLAGQAGDDSLDGGVGSDTLGGGDGNDSVIGGDGNDLLRGHLGNNTLNGGAGTDTASYSDATAGVIVSLLVAGAQNTIGAGTDTLISIENLTGSAFNDSLIGNTGSNLLIGGLGNDLLNGDGGTDTASYETASTGVTVSLGLAGAQNTVGAGTDTLSNVENLRGSNFNDTLTGNAGSNVLIGGLGNDILNGEAGTDTASYETTNTGVAVSLLVVGAQNTVGAGTDTLSNIENLKGSNFNDTLTGNLGGNLLIGGLGNDILNGDAGTDLASYETASVGVTVSLLVVGAQNTVGAGTDTLSNIENLKGSSFNDTLTGNGGNNLIIGGLGDDLLNGGAGTDTVSYETASTAVTVSLLSAGAQNTVGAGTDTLSNVENLKGSSFNDALTGNTGSNILIGGLGNDVLNGGTGTDTASYETATVGVTVNLSTVGAQNTVGAGTDTLSNIENLKGSNLSDTLIGTVGNNLIIDSLGNDVLDGGAGTDTISYETATAGVTVNLSTAGAQNTVGAGIDQLLNFENVQGSNYNDTLTGTASNNTLTGSLGNDTMTGGNGQDSFVFKTALNAVTNSDVITDFSPVDDTLVLENAIFTKFTATGAIPAEIFVANAGAVAADANDFLLYDTTTGELFYDADGNGAGAKVEFVTLVGIPALTAADFVII